mgnify:CR=1 FL=1
MAQTQEFDFEVIEKLRKVIDFGNDSVLQKLKVASQNVVDVADEVGSASLKQTGTAFVDSTNAMINCFKDLFGVCEEYSTRLKKLEQGMG